MGGLSLRSPDTEHSALCRGDTQKQTNKQKIESLSQEIQNKKQSNGNVITEILKIQWVGSRVEWGEQQKQQKFNDSENRTTRISRSEQLRDNRLKKNELSLRDLWG